MSETAQPSAQTANELNLANMIEAMADAIPDRNAVVTIDREYTYAQIDDRSTRLANHLVAQGVKPGDHVAVHSENRIEWVDAWYACFKARAVPININFKYLHDELVYLYDNSDAVAAIVSSSYVDAMNAAKTDKLHTVVVLDESYDDLLANSSAERLGGRTADDTYVIYTGGTTGAPKGVVWRQEDLMRAALNAARYGAPMDSIEQLATEAAANENPMTLLACGPMMHGGSQWIMGNGHCAGFTVSLYEELHFSPETILNLVEKRGVVSMTFLGDAMGRPVAEAVLAEPDRWDLSGLMALSNGAAPLSIGVREELRRAFPGRFLLDTYGASESGAAGSTIDDGSGDGSARFGVTDEVQVFDLDMNPCEVGVQGYLARRGPIPQGYYNDESKTAATFRKDADGVRWVIPGDHARREEDGSVTVLGRGSVCINTGGEKVHPEEVESMLMRHPDVFDAAVVGTPHERWGQQVTALVRLRENAEATEESLREFAHGLISNYKVPKRILFVDQVPRTPVSKVDYPGTKEMALQLLGDQV